MEKIIIIGGKGAAVVLADHILHAARHYNAPYELLGYSIDDPALGTEINGIPVLCKIAELAERFNHLSDVKYFFSLYKPSCMLERVRLFQGLNLPAGKFTNFIHPSSFVAFSAKMETGNVVLSNVTINTNARLGSFNILNAGVLFGHDSRIGNNNILAGNSTISSEVVVGDGNFIGLNSAIRDRVKIGDFNMIGMASAVIRDIESFTTVIGVPAKPVSK